MAFRPPPPESVMDDFRPIDVAGLAPPAGARQGPGAVPMLQWIAIDRLVVDGAYQREISKSGRANILRIAAEFRWSRFSPVIASPVAGGKLAIVDGQHRATAAALLGYAEVPCQVIIADRAEQADAFRAINAAVTRMNSFTVYHAAVAARDPAALEVARICEIAQVRVLRSQKGVGVMAPGETSAPRALLESLAAHGPTILLRALQCVTQTANNVPGALGATTIRALTGVLAARAALVADPDRMLALIGDIELEQELALFTSADGFGKRAGAFAAHLGGLVDAAMAVRNAA